MMESILYISQQSMLLTIFYWLVAVAIIVGCIWLIFYQTRIGKNLEKELEELEKIKEYQVEYEFILKAMRLSTWHIEAKTQQVTYDIRYQGHMGTNFTDPKTHIADSTKMLAPEDAERVLKALTDICSGRAEDYHQQYRVRMIDSDQYYWEEAYATIAKRDAEGLPETIVGASMRIDEQKAMEQALIAARDRAEESDRLKTAFVANMSHEIRTPLNAIIGFTSVLPDLTDDESRRQTIDLIQENNQKLLRIVNDVMTISKIEAGNVKMVMVPVSLQSVLEEAATKFIGKTKPGVKLTTETAVPQEAKTDMMYLIEMLTQLVDNAIKFTDQGTITLGYDSPADSKIRVWVRDTGKGISEQHQEKIFERFFKVDEFVPGAGLGLSVCRTIAYALGAKVGVDSTPEQGSTFWIELPA